MQLKVPLSLTLSPSNGARESTFAFDEIATCYRCGQEAEIFSLLMNLPACSPAFRRQRLLAAKQLLRIANAPAKAGTTCRNVRFMGSMREICFRRSLSPLDGDRGTFDFQISILTYP